MIPSSLIPLLFLLQADAPAAKSTPKPVVLKAARLFDGKSDSLIRGGVVVVEGKTIKAVGATGLAVPEGATVIDLGDATLCPGFIDAHTHLTHERSDDYNRGFVEAMRREVAEQAILSTVHARRTIEAGFTTVRDVGSDDFLDVGLRNSIARGVVPGPRMLVAVHGIGATGGHADRNGLRHDLFPQQGPADGIANGPDQVREAVRLQVKAGADVIKFCGSGGVLSLADEVDTPQLTLEEMTALCDEAHRLRKKVACHSHGDRAASDAVRAGVDSIEHGSFLSSDTLQLMRSQGTYLVPTLMAPDSLMPNLSKLPPEIAAKAVAANEALSKTFAEAVRLGVKIGFGTDSGVSRHGDNAREFPLMVKGGMTPIAALKAATSADAELLGLSKSIGTLEAGKLADVVALPGDPTVDIVATAHPVFVMKEGAIIVPPKRP